MPSAPPSDHGDAQPVSDYDYGDGSGDISSESAEPLQITRCAFCQGFVANLEIRAEDAGVTDTTAAPGDFMIAQCGNVFVTVMVFHLYESFHEFSY